MPTARTRSSGRSGGSNDDLGPGLGRQSSEGAARAAVGRGERDDSSSLEDEEVKKAAPTTADERRRSTPIRKTATATATRRAGRAAARGIVTDAPGGAPEEKRSAKGQIADGGDGVSLDVAVEGASGVAPQARGGDADDDAHADAAEQKTSSQNPGKRTYKKKKKKEWSLSVLNERDAGLISSLAEDGLSVTCAPCGDKPISLRHPCHMRGWEEHKSSKFHALNAAEKATARSEGVDPGGPPYPRPRGRAPVGMEWDGRRGVWAADGYGKTNAAPPPKKYPRTATGCAGVAAGGPTLDDCDGSDGMVEKGGEKDGPPRNSSKKKGGSAATAKTTGATGERSAEGKARERKSGSEDGSGGGQEDQDPAGGAAAKGLVTDTTGDPPEGERSATGQSAGGGDDDGVSADVAVEGASGEEPPARGDDANDDAHADAAKQIVSPKFPGKKKYKKKKKEWPLSVLNERDAGLISSLAEDGLSVTCAPCGDKPISLRRPCYMSRWEDHKNAKFHALNAAEKATARSEGVDPGGPPYPRPRGRDPEGMEWDGLRGVWAAAHDAKEGDETNAAPPPKKRPRTAMGRAAVAAGGPTPDDDGDGDETGWGSGEKAKDVPPHKLSKRKRSAATAAKTTERSAEAEARERRRGSEDGDGPEDQDPAAWPSSSSAAADAAIKNDTSLSTKARAALRSALRASALAREKVEQTRLAAERARIEHDEAIAVAVEAKSKEEQARCAVVDECIAKGTGEWWERYREMADWNEREGECLFPANVTAWKELLNGPPSIPGRGSNNANANEGAKSPDEAMGGGTSYDGPAALLRAAVSIEKNDETMGIEDIEHKRVGNEERSEREELYLRLRIFARKCRGTTWDGKERKRSEVGADGPPEWVRQAALDRIQFLWDDAEAKWRAWYGALKKFKEARGHVDVETKPKGDMPWLGRWLGRQRRDLMMKRKLGSEAKGGEEGSEGEGGINGRGAGSNSRISFPDEEIGRKVGPMSDERARLLEEVGLEAAPQKSNQTESQRVKLNAYNKLKGRERREEAREKEWRSKYDEVAAFREENGHANPPEDHPLFGWVGKQLRSWGSIQSGGEVVPGGMNDEKARLLEGLGLRPPKVTPAGGRRNADWTAKYDQLKSFFVEHGHADVPEGHPLSQWRFLQLKKWRSKLLGRTYHVEGMTEERMALLRGLGLEADASSNPDVRWRKNYDELKAYLDEHEAIPNREHYLRKWLYRQRVKLKEENKTMSSKCQLTAEQIELLRELKCELGPPQEQNRESDFRDDKWQEMFQQLREHKEREGDCDVPSHCNGGGKLGRWVQYQRISLKRFGRGVQDCGITRERVAALTDIGLEMKSCRKRRQRKNGKADEKWESMYLSLVEFQSREGHCKIPIKMKGLRSWCCKQRAEYKKSQQEGEKHEFSEDRVRKLGDIGFSFAPREQDWDDFFEDLVEFANTHDGNTRVPKVYQSKRGDLGSWTSRMRDVYVDGEMPAEPRKDGKLYEARLAKLRGIGFDFEKLGRW